MFFKRAMEYACANMQYIDYKCDHYYIVIREDIIIFNSLDDNGETIALKPKCFNSYIGVFHSFYKWDPRECEVKYAPSARSVRICKRELKKAVRYHRQRHSM